ncbi:uncharacterized protein LOC132751908 [Ruditapes philippinarum]|uniref:uncharacterized protein LOC132751908 n=1 Tax=Ruditapes philippinarum TaxID=129788 RepID=UPI00295C082B|nr:uncharacterized protein LOC132751908 [Ruditapes philippinarum]
MSTTMQRGGIGRSINSRGFRDISSSSIRTAADGDSHVGSQASICNVGPQVNIIHYADENVIDVDCKDESSDSTMTVQISNERLTDADLATPHTNIKLQSNSEDTKGYSECKTEDAETKLCEKNEDDSTPTLTKEFNNYILNKEEQKMDADQSSNNYQHDLCLTNYNNTNTHTWKIDPCAWERCLGEQFNEATAMSLTTSWVKSSGFQTETSLMENIPCVALYVQIKGLIPFQEKSFDKTVVGYPFDVREGVFCLCGKPGDLHQKVKMGCEIDSGYGTKQGTIGPFVQLQNHTETYFLTSVHVALDNRQMEALTKSRHDYIYYGFAGNNTFQPPESNTVGDTSIRHHLGKIKLAVYKEGNKDEGGMELALVQTNRDREPDDGYFPDDIFRPLTGYRFHFSSGRILEKTQLENAMFFLYKFGCSSGLTEGRYVDHCTSVRTNKLEERGKGVDITLFNQTQIENSLNSKPFATQGDSGSLVFAFHGRDTRAVSIFEGKMDHYYMATPIEDAVSVISKCLSQFKGQQRSSGEEMEVEMNHNT